MAKDQLEQFIIRGPFIQLDQLLKATNLCSSGGEAHAAVEAGAVKVDGVVELRKRAKLLGGEVVDFQGVRVLLVADPAGAA